MPARASPGQAAARPRAFRRDGCRGDRRDRSSPRSRHGRRLRQRDVECRAGWRSEEHTSELQSLMRISYAVFCLKKKKNNRKTTTHKQLWHVQEANNHIQRKQYHERKSTHTTTG